MSHLILDLGCGRRKSPGAIGLDLNPLPGVDVVADVQGYLPFAENSFAEVHLRHLVEHVPDLVKLMAEVHRVCQPGALARILTPHFSAAASFRDPTHVHHLSVKSFDFFCQLAPEDFRPFKSRYEPVSQRIIFGRKGRLGLCAWANRYPGLYEQHLAFLLPALEVEVVLRVVK